ncbi:MAG TPA: hypothetical protein VK184_04015 [Nostocaceae cyanobacterium]|nr:hypothetical protein [Nostocaceae cyanobacterium]
MLIWKLSDRLKPGFVYRIPQRCLALHLINASYESGDRLRWPFHHRLKPGFVYRFSQRCLALHFINASYESGDRTLFIWKLSDRLKPGFVYRFSQRCLTLHLINARYESGDRTRASQPMGDVGGLNLQCLAFRVFPVLLCTPPTGGCCSCKAR